MAKDKKPKLTAKQKRFETLSEDFRNDFMSRTTEDIYKNGMQFVSNIFAIDAAKELDSDLATLKEQVKSAEEGYKENKKSNQTKIEFLIDVLKSRGVAIASVEDFFKVDESDAADDN